jgi:hypothetical protein
MVILMTLEKKDMDRLSSSKSTDRKYPDFLGRMEKGKYYSQSEMTSLVLNKPVAIDKSLLDQKRHEPYNRNRKIQRDNRGYFFCKLCT